MEGGQIDSATLHTLVATLLGAEACEGVDLQPLVTMIVQGAGGDEAGNVLAMDVYDYLM